MQPICPECQSLVEPEKVNVAADVAHCPACNHLFKLSEFLGTQREEQEAADLLDNAPPPSGTWYTPSFDGFDLGATTRSGMALFFIPFTLLWSGGSMLGIYGSQISKGKFDPMLSLFGLPFLIGTCILVPMTLMFVMGKTMLSVHGEQARTFTGIGPIGWRRRFDWAEVTGASLSHFGESNGKPVYRIELDGPKPVKFAGLVTEKRRAYLLAMTRRLLKERRYQPAGAGR